MNARVLVHVNLRENHLLLETEGIVAISVKLLGNTVEVADTRERNADEPLEELVHLDIAESNLYSDRLALAEVEVGDIFPWACEDGLLSYDEAELCSCLLNELLVV